MKLDVLAEAVGGSLVGDGQVEIERVHADSRSILPGDLFFPKQGDIYDGIAFLDAALDAGASAVLTPEALPTNVAQVIAPRDQAMLRALCQALYDRPTENMRMVGVTGTNGKTSTCHYIEAILQHTGQKTGYLGTTEYRWADRTLDAKLTTPMFENLQHYFYQMQQDQVESAVMECSSHGIELGRIDDIAFDICVFTNLSHEHLDFHTNMQSYASAKAKLFDRYLLGSNKSNKLAVINIDDPVGRAWVDRGIFDRIHTYGLNAGADVYPKSITTSGEGMQVDLVVFGSTFKLFMPTLGTYNVMNMMAALLVCKAFDIPLDLIKQRIEQGVYIPGRLQKIAIDAPFTVIVDFAYTEDALRNVLQTLRPFCKNRLIAVFGCGGDRDATRRPKMAKAVYELTDQLIMTTDNPRTEDPAQIIEEMRVGITHQPDYADKVQVIVDRKQAIERSLDMAEPEDVVVIAGKGHETYQEIHGVRYPFSDQEIITSYQEKQ